MADPIPNDDDITKTELWKRNDYTRDLLESHKGEILYKLQTVVEDLRSQTNSLNADHTLLVHKRLSEIEGWLNAYKLEQNRTLTEAIKEIQSLFKTHLGEVEKRLKDMSDSISTVVAGEAADLFSESERRISDVEAGFADLSKGMNEALSRYQVETRTKMGDLKSKIEKVVSRLRDVFQDL